MKLSIVMPAYNERRTIREILAQVLAVDLGDLEREIVIVDDGSTDGTRDILRELDGKNGVRVLLQTRNLGKGAAVWAGMRASTGDLVVVQDADLEYDPEEYPVLLGPILSGKAEVVYGSRFLGSPHGHRVLYFWHTVGNRLLTLMSNVFTGLNLSDMETCYKVMTRGGVDRLEITCKVARMRVRIFEVPISYSGRTYEEGKKIGAKDAFQAVWTILKYFRWEAPDSDVGALTLRRMGELSDYSRWLHDRFEAWLGSRVLEVGSGVGNQTRFFADRERVVASDIEPHYVRELLNRFEKQGNVRVASFRFPLTEEDRADLERERIDTIVCLNVLEHIEDDAGTLTDFLRVLQQGGHLALLVPALPALYGTLDENLRHYRRYEKGALATLIARAGFAVESVRYLNRPGVLGWWLNSRLLRRRVLPRRQLGAFKWVMPLLRAEENTEPSFGMSLLVLARKP